MEGCFKSEWKAVAAFGQTGGGNLHSYDHARMDTSVCYGKGVAPCKLLSINPLPTIGNSLKKQKSLYKVLMPCIKSP